MRIYCIFSKEAIDLIGGNRGKLAAMAGHAFLHSYWDAQEHFPSRAVAYHRGLARKVCLVVPTTIELRNIHTILQGQYPMSLVTDGALTVFDEPTTVCLGIGPCEKLEIPNSKIFI